MKKLFMLLAVVLLMSACAGKNHHAEIVQNEVTRLPQPTKSLSTYKTITLEKMAFSEAIQQDEDKVEVAEEFEKQLQQKLQPLLTQWNSQVSQDKNGTLIIIPQLEALRIVSAGTRFWAGAWAGNSNVDMDLQLVDKQTNSIIAEPRIQLKADAMTGGWSVGASDQNILIYLTDISYEYLKKNYN